MIIIIMSPSLDTSYSLDLSTIIIYYGGLHAKSYTCAKFLDILGILNISGIPDNALIISTIMLYKTTYIVINSLSRVIRIYIIFFIILLILIFTLKTNNLDDIFKYTLSLTLNSRLR